MTADRVEPARTEAFARDLLFGQTSAIPVLRIPERNGIGLTVNMIEIVAAVKMNSDTHNRLRVPVKQRGAVDGNSGERHVICGSLSA